MKEAAGTLLYRKTAAGLEVLLIHSSGPYNRKAPWGIPKGQVDPGETLEEAARRETREETGVVMTGPVVGLGSIDYKKSKKRIHAFAGEAPADAAPRCASWEVDCSEFVPMERARTLIHPDQAPFLDRLEALLAKG